MAVSDCAASHSGSAQRSRWRSADSKRAKAIYLLAAFAHPCASQHLDILVQWARLLKRVFNIDMERCPNCQGRLTISAPAHSCARAISASLHVIAAIEDLSTIAKILKHLGLPARAPPRAPAKNHAFYEFTEFA